MLLRRLREGESAESIILVAADMQRHHRQQRPHEPLNPSANSYVPAPLATPLDTGQAPGPASGERSASSRVVFEPRIDVVPPPPNLHPRWYVQRDPIPSIISSYL